jgi:hypothetical protein
LLGADADMQPRTYASLLSIQRTELLEWALRAAGTAAGSATMTGATSNRSGSATPTGLGHREHNAAAATESWALLLLPLQPYKLLYTHTLAEYGKVSEALAYCQVCCTGWRRWLKWSLFTYLHRFRFSRA